MFRLPGNAILGGKEEDTHCDNSTWLGFLEECLNCAEEFDIWQHYGNGVTEAADACELDATPVDAEESSGTETTDNEAVRTMPTPPVPSFPILIHQSQSPTADADETEESSDAEEESGDGDSAASSMTSSASMMLFAMIAAAGLL